MSIDTTPTRADDAPARAGLVATLSSDDYCASEVFELDRSTIFHAGWMFVCHIDAIAPGHKRVFDLVDESVIVARDLVGDVRAFANVCRHRGAELCGAATNSRGSIRCAYHSWTYGLDGRLLATPRVDDEFDRDDYGLWPHHAEVWNGLIFVSVADQPVPFGEWLDTQNPELAAFGHLPIAGYKIGARSELVVEANWKIVVENYQECLHCAVVHPELAAVIPLYKTGNVVDPERDDGAVDLAPGATALTPTGSTNLARLAGVGDAQEYDGALGFPNLFFDLSPTNLAVTAIFPLAANRTRMVTEYLYDADEVARADFDPGGEFELNEIVAAQDAVVCEMVQRGVSSKAFASGVLTAKDAAVADFERQYLDIREANTPE